MRKQQYIIHRKGQIPSWRNLPLITAMLISAGSLATLAPGPLAYAQSNHYHMRSRMRYDEYNANTPINAIEVLIICQTGNGGSGGSATQNSNGADGGSGGNCTITIPINVTFTLQVPA